MTWMDRLEKKISEKGPSVEVTKVPKVPDSPFWHFCHPSRGGFPEKISVPVLRFPYHFRLKNGDGGTFVTAAATLDEARAELLHQYGEQLALVVPA